VPGPTKAKAVKETLYGPISTHCPATILRRHDAAVLFIDRDAAGLIEDK
ncbi:MAG: glucosamine-6-phosphate deaminase, partial [Firmicutes bacterium]|nr:glucosamine-6-phosphate deaminase [Bacillota bacterium]